MSNDVENPARLLSILNQIFVPLRILSVLSVLSLLSIKISFDSAQFFFYGFFVIVFSSFIIEYLHHKKTT